MVVAKLFWHCVKQRENKYIMFIQQNPRQRHIP